VKDYSNMVAQIATETRRQFPMVDRDDIVQELWVWALSHKDKIDGWLDDGKRGERSLAKALRRRARAYATVEKAARVGYDATDNYYYSTGLLRELIPQALDRESWVEPGVHTDTGKLSRTTPPSEGGNRVAMLADVRASMETGSSTDKELLWTHFGLSLDEDEHALTLGITVEALRTRLHRAVVRLQRRLGGPKPDGLYVGTRRAISNAQAIAQTRNQEAEE